MATAFRNRPSRSISRTDASRAPPPTRSPIPPGATTVHFPATTCQPCPRRADCTTARRGGRSIALHPQEAFLQTAPHGAAGSRGPRPAAHAHHHRALARPRTSDPRTQGPLQGPSQEHARSPPHRGRHQSPGRRQAADRRVTLPVRLSSDDPTSDAARSQRCTSLRSLPTKLSSDRSPSCLRRHGGQPSQAGHKRAGQSKTRLGCSSSASARDGLIRRHFHYCSTRQHVRLHWLKTKRHRVDKNIILSTCKAYTTTLLT